MKGRSVFVPVALSVGFSGSGFGVPYSRLDCPKIGICYAKVHLCDELVVQVLTEKRFKFWARKAGVRGEFRGDYRSRAFLTYRDCINAAAGIQVQTGPPKRTEMD